MLPRPPGPETSPVKGVGLRAAGLCAPTTPGETAIAGGDGGATTAGDGDGVGGTGVGLGGAVVGEGSVVAVGAATATFRVLVEKSWVSGDPLTPLEGL